MNQTTLLLILTSTTLSGHAIAQDPKTENPTIECSRTTEGFENKEDGSFFLANNHIYKIMNDQLIRNEEYMTELVGGRERFCTSRVTDMDHLFKDYPLFNQDISDWDVSQVENMSYMFDGAMMFNQSLENWDIENVADLSYMFHNAYSFNGELESWDVGGVYDFTGMFQNAYDFNKPLNGWGSKMGIVVKADFSYMFDHAYAFNQDLNLWKTNNVYVMDHMFHLAIHFNSDITTWDTSQVTDMGGCSIKQFSSIKI